MIAAVTSEYRKFFSTRFWWILLIIAFALVGSMAALLAFIVDWGFRTSPDPTTAMLEVFVDFSQTIYSLGVTFGYIFPLLVGALSVTGEWRHQTLTPTFLGEPNRVKVLSAKLIAAVPLGVVYGSVTTLGAMLCGGGMLAILGRPNALAAGDTWVIALRCVLALTLWTMIGVGLGVLLKNQVASIIVVVALNQLIAPVLRSIPALLERQVPVLKYLPDAAGDGVAGRSLMQGLAWNEAAQGANPMTSGLLDLPAGVAMMLAYVAVFSVAGYFVNWRRDIS
jgi:hypothetical protein